MQYSTVLQHAELTDIGRRRKNNQDSFRVVIAADESTWQQRGHLFMVADGMGAHAAGELASKLAVDYIPHLYNKYRELPATEALQRSIQETNAEVHRRGEANIDFHNMGTTTSVLILLPQGALIAHLGDSRVYRLRGQQLEQMTFDHSVVWELRKQGQMGGNFEAAQNFYKNVITRSLGPNPQVQVDLEGPHPIEPGDTYLLCSDGLTGQVSDEEIGAILANFSPAEAAQMMVNLANLRGGPDNITVLIARVAGESLPDRADSAASAETDAVPAANHVPLAIWAVTALLLFATGGLILAENWLLAAITGVAGLICLTVALMLRGAFSTRSSRHRPGGTFGEGPYTRTLCTTTPEFVRRLAEMARELREAAIENQWQLDMTEFERLCQSAQAANSAHQFDRAMQEYCRAVSYLMRALKQIRKRRPSDSAIDL